MSSQSETRLLSIWEIFMVKFFFACILLAANGCGRPELLSNEQVFLGNLTGTSLDDKTLSLTYDDGPSEYTLPLARWLNLNGIQATFFVVGSKAAGKEDVLLELKELGHLVGNHSYTHPKMTNLGTSAVLKEIQSTHDVLKSSVDQNFLFRAPFGAWSKALTDAVNSSSLAFYAGNIFWDIGGTLTEKYGADWNCWSASISVVECGKRYEAEVKDRGRGIVLMHDVTNQTWQMSRFLIPRLKEQGYKFVRTDEVPKVKTALQKTDGRFI
jgi:peptidoglycan/xylan/chitin deacetylase (PgdA/CDA1 family)